MDIFSPEPKGIAMKQTQDTGRSGVKTLLADLLGDVQTLIRQEVVLAQHEIQYEIDKALRAAAWFMIAGVLAVIGLLVIVAACVLILIEYTGWPAWACAAIVSVVLLGAAGWLMAVGQGVVKTIRIVPVRAVRTLKDDVTWIIEWVRARLIWV